VVIASSLRDLFLLRQSGAAENEEKNMADKKQMATRTYGISVESYEQARQVAAKNGTTVAAVVRAAVEAYAASAKPARSRGKAGVIAKESA
jgi:hypothetical protein